MSAQELREAAALMRSRAEAATTHTPWQLLADDEYAPPWTVASTHPEGERTWVCQEARHAGEHIASWHPAVALAVADLITAVADEPWCCDECKFAPENDGNLAHPALTVARAYLGGDQ